MGILNFIFIIIVFIILASIKQINEFQRGVLFSLATLNDLSSDQSNTVIFAIPIEGLEALKGIANVGKSEIQKENGKKEKC